MKTEGSKNSQRMAFSAQITGAAQGPGENTDPSQFETGCRQQVSLSVVPSRKNHGVQESPDTTAGNGSGDKRPGSEIVELQAKCGQLEKEVAALLTDFNQKNESLAEARIALRVLLDKKNEAAREICEKILFNIEKFVVPYLNKLQLECSSESQEVLLKIIQANLKQVTSSLAYTNKDDFSRLTPTQVQVMDLIKHGHSTKEIAAILNLSPSTVASHRQEIRKRLSLNNKKINLYTALNSQDL